MGAGNSTNNFINSVQSTTAELITEVAQSVGNSVFQRQGVYIDCSPLLIELGEQYLRCLSLTKGGQVTAESCHTLLDLRENCSVNGLTLSQSINLNVITDQTNRIVANLNQILAQELQSRMRAQNPILQFGNRLTNAINAFAEAAVSVFAANAACIGENVEQTQEFELLGGPVRFVTLDQTADILRSTLQDNQAMIAVTQELSAAATAELSQARAGFLQTLGIALGVVLGVIFVIGIGLVVARLLGKIGPSPPPKRQLPAGSSVSSGTTLTVTLTQKGGGGGGDEVKHLPTSEQGSTQTWGDSDAPTSGTATISASSTPPASAASQRRNLARARSAG